MKKNTNEKKLNKYIIICDESTKHGSNYSYFYGGAILKENRYENITNTLNIFKEHYGLHELKRTKITEANYKDYIEVLNLFFTFVKSGDIKIRIMFSPNGQLDKTIPHSLNETFMKFYHTFIINAFNIFYARENFRLRVVCDDLPETREQCNKFKQCLVNKIVKNDRVNANKVFISQQDIEEVDSKKHTVLQCVDVIVGLVDFALNTTEEELKKSKRAQAKYAVWKRILNYIFELHGNFILTETTRPTYSHKGWIKKYSHFVYKKKSPNTST